LNRCTVAGGDIDKIGAMLDKALGESKGCRMTAQKKTEENFADDG